MATPSPSLSSASSTPHVPWRHGFVPLSQLASIRVVRSANELWRKNQQPVITVTAALDKRDIGSVNKELNSKISALRFPFGYRWELAGDYRAQQESFASLLTVLIVAAALVFLLMGFQFRSVILPIRLFLVQPISLVSALFALWITGTPLNVSSFMGAILLIGLDVKNEIILIEYIGQLREQGMPLRDALIKAGRTRFRPILMTSLCTILGLVPLAMGFGPGAQMQQPLAIAVIGGLITNMLLTRLLIPVGYLVLKGGSGRSGVAMGHSIRIKPGCSDHVSSRRGNRMGPSTFLGCQTLGGPFRCARSPAPSRSVAAGPGPPTMRISSGLIGGFPRPLAVANRTAAPRSAGQRSRCSRST